jgi:hypothetical protein
MRADDLRQSDRHFEFQTSLLKLNQSALQTGYTYDVLHLA